MGDSGKVMLLPRGEYYSATPYEELDCVYYQGRSYVCKQASTGHAPTDTTYWQPMTPDASAEIQALTNYDANTGVKNVCPFDIDYIKRTNTSSWNGNTYTQNNASFVYDNGTVTTSGVPSAVTSPKYAQISLPAGDYIMSGCPANGSDATYALWLGVRNASDTTWTTTHKDYGNGVAFTVYEDTPYVRVETEIRPAYDGSTKVFKPMIRSASITDPTYQPYAPTNLQLENNKANKSDLASISITGTTNSTGSTIASETYFYLNGALVKAKTSIANGATLTKNTNYVEVTAGGLNELPVLGDAIEITTAESFANLKNGITYKFSSSDTGNPFTGYNVAVKVAKVTSTSGVQMAFKVVSTASTELDLLAIRPCLGGNYGAWRKFSGVISS